MTGPRMLVKDRPPAFQTIGDMIRAAVESIRPPEKLTVTEAAQRYVRIREKNYAGPWLADRTPYIVEPQDTLTSLDYTGMVFVGPARTGKSQMWLNWMTHSAMCDPEDMMLMQMSQARAREFSLSDLRKLFRNSPDVRAKLVPGRQNDNVFDKTFLSGMRVTIVHPSINELSGKTSGRNWSMDYDRLPASIDNEGTAWTLLKARAKTLGRHGMTVAESSPGFEITDAKWLPSSPHEAPPCEGILSIYNAGDRRRWFWRCPQCRGTFEPDFERLQYPKSADAMESAEAVVMVCPHNGCILTPDLQYELNIGGRWLKEGQHWLDDGSIVGTPRRSDIASFWMKGPAAGFNTWKQLVLDYINAEAEYERTGSEETLKAVVNTSLGMPYLPKALDNGRLPEELKARAWAYAEKGHVPEGVAFLITTVDVQAGKNSAFVCHTYGICPNGDIYHVDMWKIRFSNRLDEAGERRLIDPATFPEDWDVLIEEVIERTYPLADGSGRRMAVKLVASDSGGAVSEGHRRSEKPTGQPVVSTTSNAYEFWRRLRDDPLGRKHHLRFHLLKGSPAEDGSTPDLRRSTPDSQQRDKYAVARGDVPVWLVNTNQVKDQVSNRLGRTESGGQIHFPVWYDDGGTIMQIDWLYSQLTAEVRTPKGWERPNRMRKNEAFDLLAYCLAFLTHPDIRIRQFNWEQPPGWAQVDWSRNDLVFKPVEGETAFVAPEAPKRKSLAELAADYA